jgi:serine/threonine-protein kinase
MQNPFNYYGPITEEGQFLGRQGIVSKIYARIGATRPQSVSIVGDYKIGKSSLLWYMNQEKTKKTYLSNPSDYIFVSVPVIPETAKSLDTFGDYLLTAINHHVPGDQRQSSGEKVYDEIKRLIEYFTGQNKKLIIFFDDFNLITLNQEFPLDFFSFMRSMANNYNLAYVTTSYEDLQKLCISKDVEESPFFNIFTNMTLKAFEENEAVALINMSSDTGIDLAPQKDVIMEQAGLFPYPLKMACNLLFEIQSKDEEDNINESFKVSFNERIQEFYNNLWERFETTHQEIFSLLVQSRKIPQHQIYLMNELKRRDYITTKNGKPAIYSPTFQKYIMVKNNLENGSPGGIAQFFSRMWRLITH